MLNSTNYVLFITNFSHSLTLFVELLICSENLLRNVKDDGQFVPITVAAQTAACLSPGTRAKKVSILRSSQFAFNCPKKTQLREQLKWLYFSGRKNGLKASNEKNKAHAFLKAICTPLPHSVPCYLTTNALAAMFDPTYALVNNNNNWQCSKRKCFALDHSYLLKYLGNK